MERDGFNIPSSVPPYETEIKAYLINQVKLSYPKLTDYEATKQNLASFINLEMEE